MNMKKILITGLLASSMVFSGAGSAFAGNVADCVVEKANAQLSEGQAALVAAYGDNEINSLAVIRENGLNLADIARVHGFMWAAGTSCALGK